MLLNSKTFRNILVNGQSQLMKAKPNQEQKLQFLPIEWDF